MGGTIILNKKIKIGLDDFKEVISTWNRFYSYYLSCDNMPARKKNRTGNGLLKVVKALYVPDELKGTDSDFIISEISELAREGGLKALAEIHSKLKYLEESLRPRQ